MDTTDCGPPCLSRAADGSLNRIKQHPDQTVPSCRDGVASTIDSLEEHAVCIEHSKCASTRQQQSMRSAQLSIGALPSAHTEQPNKQLVTKVN